MVGMSCEPYKYAFCHFESLEQNLGGWESDEEVPE